MTELPERISVEEIRDDARRMGEIRPADSYDDIDKLRAHCKEFIEQYPIKEHCRSMAKTKLEEFCFWLRAGIGRP